MSEDPDLLLAARAAFRRGFGGIIEIRADDSLVLYADGRGADCRVSLEPPEAAPICFWRASEETLLRALSGGRALEGAFISGRLKIAGDMSVMARLEVGEGGA